MAYVIKITNQQGPWDDGEVPYLFGDGISEDLAKIFEACMARWESFLTSDAGPLVKFVKKGANHKTFVRITGVNAALAQTSSGVIGSPKKRGEEFSNFTFNTYRPDEPGSIPHEFAHVLGLAHEHHRNRAGDIKDAKNSADARLYYLGAGKEVPKKPEKLQKGQKGRRNSFVANDKNADIVYSKEDQEACWKLWDELFSPVGDYDLQSITHYPSVPNWKWTYDPFNLAPNAARRVLNLPSVEQVTNSLWKPSPTDIDALKALYAKK